MKSCSNREPSETFARTVIAIAKDHGLRCNPDTRILDLGCGIGKAVESLAALGYSNVFGFDTNPSRIAHAKENARNLNPERFAVIPTSPYRLPSDDRFFGLLMSGEVLEHVRNLRAMFSEMKRVLQPGGVGVHIFPPMFRVLEAHTHVPFGNILMARWWHRIWIRMGFQKTSCEQLSVAECAEAHIRYIRNSTFYRREHDILVAARESGLDAHFVPGLRYSSRIRSPRGIVRSRCAGWLYGTFVSKVLVVRNEVVEARG